MSAHVTIAGRHCREPGATAGCRAGLPTWRELQGRLAAAPGVAGVSPYVALEGMLAAGVSLRPALVRGVLPGEERGSDISRFMRLGSLEELTAGSRRIILGRVLALNLGLEPGDAVTLLVPRVTDGRMTPRYAAFTVAGIFEAGIQEHDSNLALVHMSDASELAGLEGAPEGVAVRLEDPLEASEFRAAQSASLDPGWRYSMSEVMPSDMAA
jgi:lipoprotein-releasing system permease protein